MDENSINNERTIKPRSAGADQHGDLDWDVTPDDKPNLFPAPPPSMPPGVLGLIDQYELVKELGGGGFGSVYLMRDPRSGVEYAVKGLPPIVRQNKEELQNVLDNFALVQKLTHPHIAAMRTIIYPQRVAYSSDEVCKKLRVAAGDPLVLMGYAPGLTLSKWRKSLTETKGLVPPEKAAEIVRQVAEALDYAHSQQILHRDIKPSNVMVEERPDGTLNCQVLDFGLAAEIRTTMGRISMEIRDVCGTRPYMAPEQWTGDRQGPGTDQYALAVLYCELVTGEVPFQSAFETGDVDVMRSAVLSRRPDLSRIPSLPRKAVRRALTKKTAGRFPSCSAFAAALKRKPSVALPVCAVLFALLSAAGAVAWWKLKDSVPAQPNTPDVPPTPLEEPASPQHVHAYGAWATNVAPTCTTHGSMIRRCENTGCLNPPASETKELAALGHAYGEWIVETPAKVGHEGRKVQVCSRCESKASESIAALPPPPPPRSTHSHAFGNWTTNVTPGCLTQGVLVRVCTNAGCVKPCMSETKPMPALGHVWSPWHVVKTAEVGVVGLKLQVCSRCRQENKREISAISPPPPPPPPPPHPAFRAADLARLDVASLTAGDSREIDIGGNVKLVMIWCPPGADVPRGFWLGKYEVTQEQWQHVMGSNPSRYARRQSNFKKLPVDSVSLYDCKAFAARLNETEGVTGFRLPSVAEWQYACQAGGSECIAAVGQINSCESRRKSPAPVGSYSPNAWGFCDMLGNVGEWTPDEFRHRILRNGNTVCGGYWDRKAEDCRSTSKRRENPAARKEFFGLRIAFEANRND